MAFSKNSRVYILSAVAYMGSFLFGYDTGVMGSVMALDSFKTDFNMPLGSTGFASSEAADIESNVVALLTAGCFFGAIAASFANDRFGRRYSLLVLSGRHSEAAASLAWTRRADPESEEVKQEIAEIKASIEEELLSTEGVTWREVLLPGNRIRFINAFIMMFWQQFSGTNSIGYYAPQLFQTIGVASTNTSLFTTGIYGIVKVVATGIFLLIGIDKVGRKWSLVAGGFWMGVMMFVLGAILVSYPPVDTSSISSASIAMIVMVYLYVIGYSASWGPIPWVYISEIFPTRLRAYGVGMGSATQWLFNFVVTKFTPAAISNIGWRTFIMFGVFCTAMGAWVLIFVKETKGRSLEDMDALFSPGQVEPERKDLEAENDKDMGSHSRHEEEVTVGR
ncbi:hypothetical protein BJX70DRAFT_395242 [Aspergillus crustosus]